jgi:putative nucleotidyltransferase with HDIG domain
MASLALRFAATFVPALTAAGSAYAAGRAAPPPPSGPAVVLWWLSLLALATIVAVLVERLARRLIPLAVLLQLSLVFPDQAPSRFRLAREAGSVRQLEDRIASAKERGVDDDPARAAEQILELVAALSAHDRKTRGHSERVRAFTDMLAAELPLSPQDRDRLRWAALLHDVGKIRVPSRILNKPGKPDPHEWERLKEHPEAGARLARPLCAWLRDWAATIPEHHERFDGRGYPKGLVGKEISLGARMVAVADSFEVMTAARAYKRPMSVPAARRELAACASAQFDPDMVRAFLNISLGRLWWTVGPASWLAATPVLGGLQRVASQAAIAAKTAAVATVFGVAGAVGHPTLAATPTRIEPAGIGPGTVVTGAPEVAADAPADPGEPPSEADDPGGSGGSGGGEDEGGGGESDVVDGATDVVDGATDLVDDVHDLTGGTVGTVVDTAVDTVNGVTDTGALTDSVDDALGL